MTVARRALTMTDKNSSDSLTAARQPERKHTSNARMIGSVPGTAKTSPPFSVMPSGVSNRMATSLERPKYPTEVDRMRPARSPVSTNSLTHGSRSALCLGTTPTPTKRQWPVPPHFLWARIMRRLPGKLFTWTAARQRWVGRWWRTRKNKFGAVVSPSGLGNE